MSFEAGRIGNDPAKYIMASYTELAFWKIIGNKFVIVDHSECGLLRSIARPTIRPMRHWRPHNVSGRFIIDDIIK
jgi:hypothetical protein